MDLLIKFIEEQEKAGKYNLDGPIGKKYQEFVNYWCNTVAVNLGCKFKTKYFSCYECGSAPQQPESLMQKYDCVMCGGRKCYRHSVIDENLTCPNCDKDKLCNNCLAFGECCRNK